MKLGWQPTAGGALVAACAICRGGNVIAVLARGPYAIVATRANGCRSEP